MKLKVILFLSESEPIWFMDIVNSVHIFATATNLSTADSAKHINAYGTFSYRLSYLSYGFYVPIFG